MAMKIDPITTGDVPIIEQLAYEYNRELDPQETRQEAVNRWITSVAEAIADGRHCFWLVRLEEQITGFVSFRLSTNPFTQETSGFIEDLYIAPSFTGSLLIWEILPLPPAVFFIAAILVHAERLLPWKVSSQ
jgi:hypothetical protein